MLCRKLRKSWTLSKRRSIHVFAQTPINTRLIIRKYWTTTIIMRNKAWARPTGRSTRRATIRLRNLTSAGLIWPSRQTFSTKSDHIKEYRNGRESRWSLTRTSWAKILWSWGGSSLKSTTIFRRLTYYHTKWTNSSKNSTRRRKRSKHLQNNSQ